MTNDKIKTKAIIIISIILLLSLICNGFLIGSINTPTTDYTKQLKLYEELNRKSNLAEGLLQERITEAEKTISGLRSVSDELRKNVRAFEELNSRRTQLDNISSSLSGRIRAEIVQGIHSIDGGTGTIDELERSEREERQALGGILTGDSSGEKKD